MTFRKKLTRILYGFICMACGFMIVVYGIVAGHIRTVETYNLLSQNAAVVVKNYESIMETSIGAINLIISEPSVLTAVRSLSSGKMSDLDITEKYYSEEYSLLREKINLYYVYKHCHRVIFFNETGDFVASNYASGNTLIDDFDIDEIEGIDGLKEGKVIVKASHKDEWDSRNNENVISVVKKLVGRNMGCFEIQWLESDVNQMLALPDNDFETVIYDDSGRKIYSSDSRSKNQFQLIKKQGKDEGCIKSGNSLLAYSYYKGYCISVSTRISFLKDIIIPILPAMFILLVVFLGVSMIFANIMTENLSKPINSLQEAMIRTDYDNLLRQPISYMERQEIKTIVEIENTYEVYENLLERLENSKKKAEKMSFLQLRAQLDLMQAQVNPHFIYNVLNIISAKGLMADDESICDMCDNLSKILRYSTNVKTKEATLRDEIAYLRDYLMLLKCRYEERLDYSISVKRDIEDVKIPKLALQQLVENAVKHGFKGDEILHVELEGIETAGGFRINIRDNGKGIEQERLDEIKRKIQELREQLDEAHENIEFEIGGMGVYNTFARLYLYYKKALTFQIDSDYRGTRIVIDVNNRVRI